MNAESLNHATLHVMGDEDLDKLAEKVAARVMQNTPTAVPKESAEPIPQPEALKRWHTTRQRLATLRRLGLLEALELNGRIYYRPQAFTEAMRSLKGTKKPLM